MDYNAIKILYSEKALSFRNKCMLICRDVILKETSLFLKSTRIRHKNYNYPFQLVVFEGGNQLGYFDHTLMEIGIAKCLMLSETSFVREVLQHELAHLITFLEFGANVDPHGKEFKTICLQHGWKESIKATISLEKVEEKSRKILKLLDLATSANPHEATSALKKAHEMMLHHNINLSSEDDDHFVIARILETKRVTEKLRAICTILRSFLVFPVINHAKGVVYLEIFGEKPHVEIAEYLAHLLDRKLDELWKNESLHRGLRAKNSFFRGIAEGFCSQIKTSEKEHGLIKFEKALQIRAQHAYPHLTSSKSTRWIDEGAHNQGKQLGSKLNIPKGVKEKNGRPLLALQNFTDP